MVPVEALDPEQTQILIDQLPSLIMISLSSYMLPKGVSPVLFNSLLSGEHILSVRSLGCGGRKFEAYRFFIP